MEYPVKQLSSLSGVSVRTLHYYDQIGLLRPGRRTDSGYRLYGEAELARLQQILFLRELQLPLATIRNMLDDPSFDQHQALRTHRYLLQLQRDRLNNLLMLAERLEKGENVMDLQTFHNSELERAQQEYRQEAENRWGGTEAYRESVRREKARTPEQRAREKAQTTQIFRNMAALMDRNPEDPAVQAVVARWQAFITRTYYPCSRQILAGLGQMYQEDPRFAAAFEQVKTGLASFFARAIAHYCGNDPLAR